MKVYFISSPRAKAELEEEFELIYKTIEDLGHQNLTDFIINVDTHSFYSSDISKFYEETSVKLKHADVCIFEASTPSLAIGHLINAAFQLNKPVVVLYKNEKIPFFLSGIKDERLQVLTYDKQSLKAILGDAIEYAKDQADTRFNFFISPRHVSYLDWISKTKRVPRSVYLRGLIKGDMEKNPGYQT